MAHVFISYSRVDSSFAQLLKLKLEKDFDLWIDTERLLAGDDWRIGIDEAIQDSYALIVVMSPESAASRYVTYEWAYALGIGVKVIPLLIKPHTDFHPRLDVLQRFDFTNPDPALQPWAKLIARLNGVSDSRGSERRVRASNNIPPAIQQAILALDSSSESEQLTAIESLAQMNHPSSTEALANAAEHPVKNVRIQAAFKLAYRTSYKDKRSLWGLLEGLRLPLSEENEVIRKNALQALIYFGIEAESGLIESTKDINPDVRRLAISALGNMESKNAIPAILNCLSDQEELVREACVDALANINDTSALQALRWKLHDSSPRVRKSAAWSLGYMGDTESIPELSHMLNDTDNLVSLNAELALKHIGTPEALAAIEQRDPFLGKLRRFGKQ